MSQKPKHSKSMKTSIMSSKKSSPRNDSIINCLIHKTPISEEAPPKQSILPKQVNESRGIIAEKANEDLIDLHKTNVAVDYDID